MFSVADEKVAGAWADLAADQDVPLQADHHQSGAGLGEPSQRWRDLGGSHEDVS